MKLAIVIPTYQRADGATPKFLTRALKSIFAQTHEDFKIFIIGDKYENKEEIQDILNQFPQEKISFENLPFAKERDKYTNKKILWSYGGVNANNTGIEMALKEGFSYICHLDHDDYWSPIHLSLLNSCINDINCDWICTKSRYLKKHHVPQIENGKKYIPWLPVPGQLVHSSTCINFKTIPLKYRDVYARTGVIGMPADGDLWHRMSIHIKNNKLRSCCVNHLTCYQDNEGYVLKS